ncbi:MAG: hypothetical protein ACK5RG_19855 [Cyclobacteriaceae bacterium]|jgi:hypothetical protein
MENKFKEGEEVFDAVHPNQKLIIRKYYNRIYYCKVVDDPSSKELAYFERELTGKGSVLGKGVSHFLVK